MPTTKKPRRSGLKYVKNGYYKHHGDEIVGLKRRPDGRFYAAKQPSKTFGKDPAAAVHRFRLWEAEQDPPKRVSFQEQREPSAPVKNEWRYWAENHPDPKAREYYREALETNDVTFSASVALDSVKDYFRNLILTDPRQAAIELDIPHLADYPAQKTDPDMTLIQLGEKYRNEKRNKRTGKAICPQEKRQSKKWWEEFCDIVKVKYAKHITETHIDDYHAWVMAQFDKGMSTTWVKHRFGKVRAVLGYAITKNVDSAECQRVLGICKRVLDMPKTDDPNPERPSRQRQSDGCLPAFARKRSAPRSNFSKSGTALILPQSRTARTSPMLKSWQGIRPACRIGTSSGTRRWLPMLAKQLRQRTSTAKGIRDLAKSARRV